MSLSKTLEEIKNATVFANENVEDGPLETLNGRRGRKNQAIERLKQLKREYREKLRNTTAFILVVGDKKDIFVSTAVENFKCFEIDPNSFYSDLAGRVTKMADIRRESSSTLLDILGRHLEEKANELDIIQYNQLIFNQKYRQTLNSNDEFVSWVRQVINDQVGPEIVGIQTIQSLVDVAIKANHAALVSPVLLPTNDEKFALEVLKGLSKVTSRVFLVSAGKSSKAIKSQEGLLAVKEPNNESVQQALKTISDSLKR